MKYSIFLLSFFIIACSSGSVKNIKEQLPKEEEGFSYTDKNGEFKVKISAGLDKAEKVFITKKKLEIPDKDKDNVLEQSIAFSDLGMIKKKNPILRPKMSQYNVWFDGKKYFSELKIVPEKRSIDVKMVSPESQWNGSKTIKFPSTKIMPCFFSQVIECAKVSGFIKKSSKKENGAMSLLIIWEGYPYLNETFSDFPSELFSKATLEYDGKLNASERRFNLRVAGQSIFYILNDKDQMMKMFWVTQGISMINKNAPKDQVTTGGDNE